MPTPDEFAHAVAAARRHVRFECRGSAEQWSDIATDAANDALMRAIAEHIPAKGTFEVFAAACVRRQVRRCLIDARARSARPPRLRCAECKAGAATPLLPDDLLATLTDLQREVVTRKYDASESYAEIGRSRGVSKQAIHRVHKRALNKLKTRI